MRRKRFLEWVKGAVPRDRVALALLVVATTCSLALTLLTILPPSIPADWAHLDQFGIYIPQNLGYNWPPYGIQVGFWLVMVGALWVVGRKSQVASYELKATSQKLNNEAERVREYRLGYVLAVAGLTLVGFAMRLYTLTRLPLIIDEIAFAAHASDILHGQLVPILAPGHYAHPSLHSWLMAGSMAIFGQTAFAMRLIPLAFGTVSIPAVYVLGREWWSKRGGLIAAAFLATYPVHVFYSRISLNNIEDPLFMMLGLAHLARAVRTDKLLYFILAGIMAGVAQYFYHGARLLPILMAVYGVVVIYNQRWPRHEKAISPTHVFWLGAAFALTALPCLAATVTASVPITGNVDAIRLPPDLPANTLRAILAWVGQPDVSPFWMSNQPLLLWPAAIAFLAGLWFCLRHWRDPRSVVLMLSIVLATIFGGAILTSAPLYVRYMATVPTVALLVAIGIEKIVGAARGSANPARKWIEAGRGYAGALLLVTLVVYGSVVSIVIHPAQAYAAITAGHWEEDKLARKAADVPADMAVLMAVSAQFDAEPIASRALQIMSLAHYVAAYGERRTVILAHAAGRLTVAQARELRQMYVVLTAN